MEIPQFAASIITALVAAGGAAWLATRRTKSETRWKAKYDAHERILRAVEDIRYWAEETYASNLLLSSISREQLDAASTRFEEAKRILWSYVQVGALVIADEARQAVETFLTELASEEHRFNDDFGDPADYTRDLADHCDSIRRLVDKHLGAILAAAKTDLK